MSNRNDYIGVFDSGVGGLTVLKEMMERLPNEKIIYFGDTANVPYGTKSDEQIKAFAKNDIEFLLKHNVKAVVIACNTADSVARSTLEENYDIPIFGVIDPASKEACDISKNKRIGVMATVATVASGSYEKMMKAYDDVEVFSLACPLLVPLVENGRYKKDDVVVREVLKEYLDELLKHDVDTIVLGCTHYPLLKDAILDLVGDIQIVSSSKAAVNAITKGLEEAQLLSDTTDTDIQYYVSDAAEHFKENAKIFIGDDFSGEVIKVSYEE